MTTLDETQRQVAITAHDLPLACPRPGAPCGPAIRGSSSTC
jgi:hypothetical protein